MYCQKCGYKNEDGAIFCECCGSRLEENVQRNANFQNRREINYGNSPSRVARGKLKKGVTTGIIAIFVVLVLGLIVIFGPDLFKKSGKDPDKNSVENVTIDDKKDRENNSYEDYKDENSANSNEDDKEKDKEKENSKVEDYPIEDNEKENKDENIKEDEPKKTVEIIEVPAIFVGASSTLAQKDIIHYPKRTVDNDLSTAWSEGVDGPGLGETIDFGFDTFFDISSIKIWNGYHKSERLYFANNRPKRILVEVSSSEDSFTIELQDIMEPQIINLPKPISTNHVSFTIEDVYYGNSFDDTCITDVKFFGN